MSNQDSNGSTISKIFKLSWMQPRIFEFDTIIKHGGLTVVLEAMSDYHLWFGHASFGYAGSLNDLNILNLTPFLEYLVDGSFKILEEAAGIVPFDVGGENFNALFPALLEGIYPRYSRFVKGISMPVFSEEIAFSAWQESSRKDIERAVGVLQCRFQVMARPSYSRHVA